MSSSKPSPKKPAIKPQVKVPTAAAPDEKVNDSNAKKTAAILPVVVMPPKAATTSEKPAVVVKQLPVVKPAAVTKPTPVVKAAPKPVAKSPVKPPVEVKAKTVEKIAPAPATKAKKDTKDATEGKPVKGESKRRIDTPEIQEKIRELIKLAKEQDYLTYDDINEILPNDLVDPDDVEAIMERLRNMEFDIIDASEVDRYKDKKRDEGDIIANPHNKPNNRLIT